MNPPQLIGLTGKKKAGKDTAFQLIQQLLPRRTVIRLGFADALKKEVAAAINQKVEFIDKHKDNFRLILQGWGTDFRRKLYGEDYWIKKWQKTYEYLFDNVAEPLIIVPDVRFENEFRTVLENGGICWQVVAENTPFEEMDSHASEAGIWASLPILRNDFQVSACGEFKEQIKQQLQLLQLLP